MTTHITQSGQDILDITIQQYGSAEYFFDLLTDNEQLSVNSNVGSKDKIIINNNEKGVVRIKEYFEKNINTIVNSDSETLGKAFGDWTNDWSSDFNL